MQNEVGSFLQGMSQGMGMGLKAKNMNKTTQNTPQGAGQGMQGQQDYANNAFNNGGMPSYGGEGMGISTIAQQTGQEGTKDAIQARGFRSISW